MALTLLAFAFMLVSRHALPSTVIRIWDLEHLGWNNCKRLDAVADVAKGADLWALEEVMDVDAVTQLEHEVERQTGEEWSSMASLSVGRNSYRESYAYLW